MICEHVNCECEVSAGDSYCSTYCREAVEAKGSSGEADFDEPEEGMLAEDVCECGHAQCESTIA